MEEQKIQANLKALGACIRTRRRELGLTQTGLAERTGWVQERISLLEGGKYGMPSLPALARLANALEISLNCLIEAAGFELENGAGSASGLDPSPHGAVAEPGPEQGHHLGEQRVRLMNGMHRLNGQLERTQDVVERAEHVSVQVSEHAKDMRESLETVQRLQTRTS